MQLYRPHLSSNWFLHPLFCVLDLVHTYSVIQDECFRLPTCVFRYNNALIVLRLSLFIPCIHKVQTMESKCRSHWIYLFFLTDSKETRPEKSDTWKAGNVLKSALSGAAYRSASRRLNIFTAVFTNSVMNNAALPNQVEEIAKCFVWGRLQGKREEVEIRQRSVRTSSARFIFPRSERWRHCSRGWVYSAWNAHTLQDSVCAHRFCTAVDDPLMHRLPSYRAGRHSDTNTRI